jgi:hypothetical protein
MCGLTCLLICMGLVSLIVRVMAEAIKGEKKPKGGSNA